MEHWHIDRNTDEDSIYIAEDIFGAFDIIETELRDLADFAFEGISAMGDNGMYEDAYKSFKDWQTYDNVLSNIRNMLHQRSFPADSPERAPLYQSDCKWAEGTADGRLLESAHHVASLVNNETPLAMWECTQDDIFQTEEDIWEVKEDY